MLADLTSPEGSLLGLQTATSSLCFDVSFSLCMYFPGGGPFCKKVPEVKVAQSCPTLWTVLSP